MDKELENRNTLNTEIKKQRNLITAIVRSPELVKGRRRISLINNGILRHYVPQDDKVNI
ncbi:MAG: hypothetical protein ABIH21_05780 [Patescibacteria group bacterium]